VAPRRPGRHRHHDEGHLRANRDRREPRGPGRL